MADHQGMSSSLTSPIKAALGLAAVTGAFIFSGPILPAGAAVRHHRAACAAQRHSGRPGGCERPALAAAQPDGLTAPLQHSLVIGLNANTAGWGNASTVPRLQQVVSQTQASWLREEFQWSMVEPTEGTYDWSYYDHYMQAAAQQGVHILALCWTPPQLGRRRPKFDPVRSDRVRAVRRHVPGPLRS